MRAPRLVLWLLVLAGAAAAVLALVPRIEVERSNRTVDVVLDYNGLADFCESEGVPVPEALELFRKEGISGLAYPENTLDRLRDEGRLAYYGGADYERALRAGWERRPAGVDRVQDVHPDPSRVYVVVYEPRLLKELMVYLKLYLGSAPDLKVPLPVTPPAQDPAPDESPDEAASPSPAPADDTAYAPRFRIWPSPDALGKSDRGEPLVLEVSTSLRTLQEQGLGFTRADLALAEDAGLACWLRPENRARFSEKDIRGYFFILGKIMRQGARGVIFSGGSNEVVGFPDHLDVTVEEMRKLGLLFGNIEVSTADAAQKGSQTLGTKLAPQTVRVMSFSPAFQAKLTPEDVTSKFVLGVRERNIRFLYLRFFTTPKPGQTVLATNLEYVRDLKAALEHAGYAVGPAQPFTPIYPATWALVLMTLGAAAGAVLLLRAFLDAPQQWEISWPWRAPALRPMGSIYEVPARLEYAILVGAPFLMFALDRMGRWALGAKLVALAAAVVFATLGICLFLQRMLALSETEKSPAHAMFKAAGYLLLISGLSVAGGVLVSGLLAATPFMLSVDQFRGIKLVMLLPPALVVLFYVLRCAPDRRTLSELGRSGVQWWQVALMVILMGAGVFYIMRTGNTPVGGASDTEIALRTLLEDVLGARPRFKEFALGHPAWILLGLLIWERRLAGFWWMLVLAAGIGQADIVDTFAHIHTPYLISLLRVGNGLWLGILIGFLAGIVVLWLLWKGNRPSGARTLPAAD